MATPIRIFSCVVVPIFGCLLLASACTEAPVESGDVLDDNSTFGMIQMEIFAKSCATTGCHRDDHDEAGKRSGTAHGDLPSGGLSLVRGEAYDELVNVDPQNEAARDDGMKRVVPGDPARSLLYMKVHHEPEAVYGNRMPLGSAALDSGKIEFIREWIAAGAPRTGVVADTAWLYGGHGPGEFEPLPLPAEGFQLHLPPFSIPAHGEREVFYATHADQSRQTYLTKLQVKLTDHSHHFILYNFTPGDPFRPDADVIRNRGDSWNEWLYDRRFIFGTQEADVEYELPPGVGIPVTGLALFDLNMHSLNDEGDTAFGEAYVNIHTTDHVDKVAASLLWSDDNIWLPAHQQSTIYDTLEITEATELVMLTSHFHRHGLEFRIFRLSTTGTPELIYRNTEWDHPLIRTYDPPLMLQPGERLTLEALYFNDHDAPIVFGPSAEDEMCSVFGLYIEK